MAGRSKTLTPLQAGAKATIRETRRSIGRDRLPFVDAALIPDPAERLKEIMADLTSQWYHAVAQRDAVPMEDFWVRKYDAQGNLLVEPHPWYQEAERIGLRLEAVCQNAIKNGLAERMAAIEEFKAAMFIASLRQVLDRLQLTPEQRALVGPALHEARETLLGGDGIEPVERPDDEDEGEIIDAEPVLAEVAA